MLGAGLVGIPLGALVAIPAIRLSGLYLALATFGLGILVERMAYFSVFMFGPEYWHQLLQHTLSLCGQ